MVEPIKEARLIISFTRDMPIEEMDDFVKDCNESLDRYEYVKDIRLGIIKKQA